MTNLLKRIFSTTYAGLYIILMALAMAVGTFIENDYGTQTAQKLIYHAKWFEVLHLLFAITLIVNVVKFKLFTKAKMPSFIFHIAMVVIIFGAAITRYISYEGTMQIKEGESNNTILSLPSYLQLRITDGEEIYSQNINLKFGTYLQNSFSNSYKIKDKIFDVKLLDFLPNVEMIPVANDTGASLIHIITTGAQGRDSKFLSTNESININGIQMKFYEDNDEKAIHVKHSETRELLFNAPHDIHRLSMSTRIMDTLMANTYHKFEQGHLHTINGVNIVLKDYFEHGEMIPKSTGIKLDDGQKNMMVYEFKNESETKIIQLVGGKGIIGSTEKFQLGNLNFETTYGPKPIKLPFSIQLNDFELERYAGSNTPSSYSSEVTLIDKKDNNRFDYKIYMNHILNYKGYKFFQSSYTPDEKSTILSVNHDYWGTLVSYLGYFLLTFGFILNLFMGKSRFLLLFKKLDQVTKKRKTLVLLGFFIFSQSSLIAQDKYVLPDSIQAIPLELAEAFGKLQIQDLKGRIKPINTYSSEILRKIAYKSSVYGLNSDQVLFGLINNPEQWHSVPLISVKHPKLKQILGVTGDLVPFSNFLDHDYKYVLQEYVEKANQTNSGNRGTFDRAVINMDERFNVLYMAFTGQLLKLFPKQNDPSRKWYNPNEAFELDFGEGDIFVKNYFKLLHSAVEKALKTNNIEPALETINYLNLYQNKLSSDLMLSENKLSYEILYNKYNIFAKLIGIYLILGFLLLIALFIQLLTPKIKLKWPITILVVLILLSSIAHTYNIGLRWYLSERAPWSNGYESLTFIAWSAMLAGIVFIKKSKITLAATTILSFIILGVAGLSWLSPEITNLQPVLKSYWLTIHVSIITASYGFLGLGALLGFLVLILYIIRTKNNKVNVMLTIKELTYVNEMTVTLGIFLLATGTYLGGIWANESWGRYWGWDSKETWALISVMIYAFVLHMRLIPGLKGKFAFNLASLISIGSIIMTYFGVNYYLSGLHSYATGDPVPIPNYVYYLVAIVFTLGIISYWRKQVFEKNN